MPINLKEEMERIRDEVIRLRRDFHQYPELSHQEHRTMKILAQHLAELGYSVETNVGGTTGVVGSLEGGNGTGGKSVLFRADVDALPITELNEVAYQSKNPGVMHACAHDGHAAVGLMVADILAKHRAEWNGKVRIVFQPAEETSGGATPMVQAGVTSGVDTILGMHIWNYFPAGSVAVKPGAIFSSVDEFIVTIQGRGGHGAMPHQTVDPIVIAAHLITTLQTVVSREISPFDTAVISIGSIHGGTAFNVIPDEVVLKGTLRTLDKEIRQRLRERIEILIQGIVGSMRGTTHIEWDMGTSPVINDPGVTELLRAAAREIVGEDRVLDTLPTTAGDDMAVFNEQAPACYSFMGANNPSKGFDKPHHNARFDFDDENTLPAAVAVMTNAILKALQS